MVRNSVAHDKNRQQILVIKLKVCQQADLVKDPGIVDYLPSSMTRTGRCRFDCSDIPLC